ncbi:MAG: magnesium transporter [Fimbriimonadaceae bacterium]
MRTDDRAFIDVLRSLARMDDPELIADELEGVLPGDYAEAFQRMETEEALAVLKLLDAETAGYVLVELPTEIAKKLIDELPDEAVAHYLDVLPMDDAVELREELEPDRFDALLEVIPREDAQEIRRLLSYPDGTAGRLMTENFVLVGPESSMLDVLEVIRLAPDTFETVNYIYVLSSEQHLLGVLTLRRVLRSEPSLTAREVMNSEPITVLATLEQEDLAKLMARYGFSAIPVLDDRGRMVGIVTADDAQSVLQDAATEDVLKLGAVMGDAEAYLSLNVFQLVKRRLPWLLILFIAEFLTGAVLRRYVHADEQSNLAAIAKLTLFIPLIIGAGGNSGSQVTTTITRALAVGEVRTSDAFKVLRREMATALLMGLSLGLLGFLRAFWGWNSGFGTSLVVGIALPAIVMWAATVGSVLPIGAKRLGFDPAVMSAPFITTFVDATGLVIYFEIARQVLGLEF